MINMSYCRFHNTNLAVDECLNVLEDPDDKTISKVEKDAAKKLFERFLEFCVDNYIIEDYDSDIMNDIINSIKEE